ncbi:hypothetical protein GCM10010451_50810 [Streptomyces virens]|uniref:Uncharacterized protein n=1 Tax=Streptomyces virens TaxID=285572 RepID=A0ABP6PWY6_9ACTN|nr:hypothetical protein GCM10010247_50210 [Streptomyces calvus]
MPEVEIGDGDIRMLCLLSYIDPKSTTGLEPATLRSKKYPLPAHRAPSRAAPPEIKSAAAWIRSQRRSRRPRTGRCMKLWCPEIEAGGTDKVL